MAITDPVLEETGESSRLAAVRATWSRLLDESDYVKVGILKFSANAKSETVEVDENGLPVSYFTRNETLLEDGTIALESTERTTNFGVALDEAYSEMRAEMLRMDEKTLGRSKFVVIFLSDGMPDRGGGWQLQSIRGARRQHTAYARPQVGVCDQDIQLHTAYISSDALALVAEDAQCLLRKMADAGGGTYRSFLSGERLDFLHIDLTSIKRLFTLESLVAFNTNMVRDKTQMPTTEIHLGSMTPRTRTLTTMEKLVASTR